MFLKAERLGNFIFFSKNINFIDRLRTVFSKRFTHKLIQLNNKSFGYTDSLSFMTMYSEIFLKRIYDFRADNNNPLIIDCGSNIGLSVIFFKNQYPDAEIHAYEPDPNVFTQLEKNISPYLFKKVFLRESAIWKNDEDISFMSQGGSSGKIGIDAGSIKVRTTRLRSLLNKTVDFLKIDIEGAEYEVLKDCALELHNVKNLFIEYHSFTEEPQVLNEILYIIKKSGFTYYIQHETSSNSPFIKVNTIGNMNAQLNIFCYR
jgi:FkbM family methyltransferase